MATVAGGQLVLGGDAEHRQHARGDGEAVVGRGLLDRRLGLRPHGRADDVHVGLRTQGSDPAAGR